MKNHFDYQWAMNLTEFVSNSKDFELMQSPTINSVLIKHCSNSVNRNFHFVTNPHFEIRGNSEDWFNTCPVRLQMFSIPFGSHTNAFYILDLKIVEKYLSFEQMSQIDKKLIMFAQTGIFHL